MNYVYMNLQQWIIANTNSMKTIDGVREQIRSMVRQYGYYFQMPEAAKELVDLLNERATVMENAKRKRQKSKLFIFDTWYSDDNNRQCIGAISVHGRTESEASWKALDMALKEYSKVPEYKWEKPSMDAGAILDYHPSGCECECHTAEFDEEGEETEVPGQDAGCENCWQSDTIMMEVCEYDGIGHYWAHSNLWEG